MQSVLEKNEKDLENLKLDLISRKVKKIINENNLLDDNNIKYLDDCLNLYFGNSFSFKDLMLVIRTNKIPSDYFLSSEDILEITLNGINTDISSNFIILEPLENQINTINKIDVETTRLSSVTLNPKSILLVNEDREINNNILKNYRVIRYKGDIKVVLAKVLILYGYKPQEIADNQFQNQGNNQILINYLRRKYPNKISIKNIKDLIDKQKKELSVRNEVLSIIRDTNLLTIDDIDISSKELVILAEYYKNIYGLKGNDMDKIEFSEFINIYGVRLNASGIYLLDDDSLIKSGYANSKMIDELYKIYLRTKKNYKERLGILANRKKILHSIMSEGELKDKKSISVQELGTLYKAYQKDNSNNSVQKFMQDIGIRINKDRDEIYLLNDNETINLINFVESNDEDAIAIYLREDLSLDCYTEGEKELGIKLKNMNSVNLSFDGLEELFTK